MSRTHGELYRKTKSCQNVRGRKGIDDMPTNKLTNEIIDAAILGFEAQKRGLDVKIADLRAMLSGAPAEPIAAEEPTKRRKKMSAAGRRAIAAGQRKRWAAAKGQSETKAPKVKKAKRKLSAEGRAAIVAALKKRWAAKKAATKK
jgi:hypothetical protein